MKQVITIFLILSSVLTGSPVQAQTDISMATHWYNRANYNPAFIARTDYLYFFTNARNQWVGVNGAPQVVNVQLSGYFYAMRSAFGISVVNDKIGLTRATNPMLTYAYRMAEEHEKWSLALGLSVGMLTRTLDGSLYEAETISDPSIAYSKVKTNRPDANVGAEFQNVHFIFGLSSTHLLSIGKSDNLFLDANHRYAYAIYKNNNLRLFYYKIGLQAVNRYNLTVVEGNLSVRLKNPTGLMKGPREILDFGVTLRSSRQMTLLIGVLLTPDLRIGYAYDQSAIQGYYQNTTHEIMLEYRISCRYSSTHFQCERPASWYH